MTDRPVRIEDLTGAQETLIESIVGEMPAPHRRFLLSFERGEPDWPLLDVPGAKDLPAVRWRQRNLDTLKAGERARLVSQLEGALSRMDRFVKAAV